MNNGLVVCPRCGAAGDKYHVCAAWNVKKPRKEVEEPDPEQENLIRALEDQE